MIYRRHKEFYAGFWDPFLPINDLWMWGITPEKIKTKAININFTYDVELIRQTNMYFEPGCSTNKFFHYFIKIMVLLMN